MSTDQNQTFDEWAILEVMGHQRYVGKVSEQSIGGASFVRIDVPAVGGAQAFTKLFGGGSIYCITPVSEAIARAMAAKQGQTPFSIYDLPESMRRPAIEQQSDPLELCDDCGGAPCHCDVAPHECCAFCGEEDCDGDCPL